MQGKHVAVSKSEQIQILMPPHINGAGRLFGGQLMQWIDIVAAVVARRHSGHNVTTVTVDNLHFKEAAYANDTIVLVGQITHVGRTSMEVRVETFVEALDGGQRLVNRAYLVMVAIGDDGRPTPVPPLIVEDEAQHAEWEAGCKRHALRKQRRAEQY